MFFWIEAQDGLVQAWSLGAVRPFPAAILDHQLQVCRL
jgi:hypothetical protein